MLQTTIKKNKNNDNDMPDNDSDDAAVNDDDDDRPVMRLKQIILCTSKQNMATV